MDQKSLLKILNLRHTVNRVDELKHMAGFFVSVNHMNCFTKKLFHTHTA